MPCCHDPLGRYGDEAEDKSLYATRFLEPESLGVKLANDGLIEIVYQCRKQKEYSVLGHERLGEPVPAESVDLIIVYTLFAPSLGVKFDDVSC